MNLKQFSVALNKAQGKVVKQVNKELAGTALRTVAVAKNRLRVNSEDSREMAFTIGAVRQSINFIHDPKLLSASVFAGNTKGDHMAAYLEFGTGRHAARYVPTLLKDFQALARTFYVNGKGTLKEHPYLIPAYMQEGARLKERLKNMKIGW
ncbi:hypothetical protein MUK70_11865 [Dyadobacter chenwenxiniae]|uniref:hypothetical protein n=1 Tax=Dyadobacter chenwenxiniae TaxID=2906456 RepID=UPI001FD14C1F|nr:hypothetical protein [Dyadobacter chenwenxiniae]UON85677.1 hypothetical protein MUK70_11865 [Dyadobacter chenwenxiniae]